jgi:hypothetical protein
MEEAFTSKFSRTSLFAEPLSEDSGKRSFPGRKGVEEDDEEACEAVRLDDPFLRVELRVLAREVSLLRREASTGASFCRVLGFWGSSATEPSLV